MTLMVLTLPDGVVFGEKRWRFARGDTALIKYLSNLHTYFPLPFVLNDVYGLSVRIKSLQPLQPAANGPPPNLTPNPYHAISTQNTHASIMSRPLRALCTTPLLRSASIPRPLLVVPVLRPRHVQRRQFVGQILGIIANPFETLRQLDESRKLLEQTRQVQPPPPPPRKRTPHSAHLPRPPPPR